MSARARNARRGGVAAAQIIITARRAPSRQLSAQLLCCAGDSAWIDDPGYWGVRSVLTAAGVRTVPLPVDDEGMRFDIPTRGRQRSKPPRLMVVSPSH
ncbi:PLP-dependent aminotransferase family protein, partial [Escherichia coli]|nr:PLP-dependent aminotransferase family protein [Escherichia coli]